MNLAQRLVANIGILGFSQVMSYLLGLVGVVYIGRILGPEGLGTINFANAFVSYFLFLANWGITLFIAKQLSCVRDNLDEFKRWVGYFLGLRFVLCLLAYLALVLVSLLFLAQRPITLQACVLIYGLRIIVSAIEINVAFYALEKMEYLALAGIVGDLLSILFVVSFIKGTSSVILVALFYFWGMFLATYLTCFLFLKRAGRVRLLWDAKVFWQIIINSLPLGIAGMGGTLLYQVSPVVLGMFQGATEVGYYSAGHKIISLLIGISTIYYTVLFPVMAHSFQHHQERFIKVTRYTLRIIFGIGLPVVVGLFILARDVMWVVFGRQFMSAVSVLVIFCSVAPFIFLNQLLAQILLVGNRQSVLAKVTLMAFFLCVVISVSLARRYGAAGVACGLACSQVFSFFYYYVTAKKFVEIKFLKFFARPACASLIMAAGIIFLKMRHVNIFYTIPLASVIYFFSLFILRGIRQEELFSLRELLARN